jgi:glutamate decarboxylase
MALHSKDTIRPRLDDEVFGSTQLAHALPKYRFPDAEMPADRAYQVVHDELLLDGNARMNLATFCQTWEEPEVHRLMNECIDKNMIDKDEYPQTAELEARCVHMLAELWNSPKAANTVGTSTTGSSEAAMLGGLSALWRWRAQRKAAGKATDKPNMVCGPVQICWHKFARYWDVEIREIPCEGSRLIASPDEVLKRVDENTICVVPTLGVTFTLAYEPVEAIAAALDDLQKKKGLDVPIHVDGASGGFLAPFIQKKLVWDFRLPRVKSINASGHKFGLSPLGVGWVIWRDAADLPRELVFNVNYLGGNMPTFALNFSRPGGQIVAQYYNFVRLGREGYAKVQQACADVGTWLADEIGKLGPFSLIYDGRNGVPGCTWTFKDGKGPKPPFTLYDLADRLRSSGWLVPAYSMPQNRTDLVVQRVLVKNGFSRDMASLLVEDMKRALAFFEKHPVSNALTEAEAGSFKHSASGAR